MEDRTQPRANVRMDYVSLVPRIVEKKDSEETEKKNARGPPSLDDASSSSDGASRSSRTVREAMPRSRPLPPFSLPRAIEGRAID